jgi:hypothetical protein
VTAESKAADAAYLSAQMDRGRKGSGDGKGNSKRTARGRKAGS